MKFYPGVTLVTLGVDDVDRASRFYESLGWRRSLEASQPSISFFQLNTLAIALFGRADLARDAGVDAAPSRLPAFTSITLDRKSTRLNSSHT